MSHLPRTFTVIAFVWLISVGTLGWIIHIWSIIDAARWKPV